MFHFFASEVASLCRLYQESRVVCVIPIIVPLIKT